MIVLREQKNLSRPRATALAVERLGRLLRTPDFFFLSRETVIIVRTRELTAEPFLYALLRTNKQ